MSLKHVGGEDVRLAPEDIPGWFGGPQKSYERPRTVFSNFTSHFGRGTQHYVEVVPVAEAVPAPQQDWTDGGNEAWDPNQSGAWTAPVEHPNVVESEHEFV